MIFQLYSEYASMQLIGWVLVFLGLILVNEIGRRTKAGEIIRRSVKLGKNPYSNDVFADIKDFKAALERCEM
ncbi:MAG: hypothetical protein K6G26_08035 [Lachnospiraceae bacterium]|nr:hypothetical protein [Lachnospiraceae bacterium]